MHKVWTSLGEQLTPSELVDTMLKNLESSDKSACTKFHFKQKLLENYGDELVTSNEDEKPDIATLKSSVNTILRNSNEAPKYINIHLQKIILLTTAAKLIKTKIQNSTLL